MGTKSKWAKSTRIKPAKSQRTQAGGQEISGPLQGVQFLKQLRPLLERPHNDATERDGAGNRRLHFDELCGLIPLIFFHPSIKTLLDLCEASRLKQVRKKLGCNEASLGSLSEALRVFDPDLLAEVVQDLLGQRGGGTRTLAGTRRGGRKKERLT